MCCRVGDSPTRHSAADWHRASLKWNWPQIVIARRPEADVAISQYTAASWENDRRNRNCLPEIAPQGHFLALRAQGATAPLGPRNDKLEGLAPQNACRKDCQLAWRSLSAATDAIGAHHFNGGLYGLQVPSRDCHVGLRPPRNDKLGAFTILTMACTVRRYRAGPGCPLPYNARPETFRLPHALQYSARNVAFFSGTW